MCNGTRRCPVMISYVKWAMTLLSQDILCVINMTLSSYDILCVMGHDVAES